ncbi:lipoate--protein ligase family protein [bacterium]|nr:lipoate--protein ligase family protein [bacterium]
MSRELPALHVLPEREISANLAAEAALLEQCAYEQRAACLFYVNDPCIVLGRSNQPSEWVDIAQAEADGIPVVRRISGGGTVYHDNDNLNFSFIVPRAQLNELCGLVGEGALSTSAYIDFFRSLVIGALSVHGGEWTATGTSDISLNGRKVSGNAQRIAHRAVLHHGTLMLHCPLTAIERYLPIPPDRPGVSHADFITGLAEEGYPADMEQLREWLYAAFVARLSAGRD